MFPGVASLHVALAKKMKSPPPKVVTGSESPAAVVVVEKKVMAPDGATAAVPREVEVVTVSTTGEETSAVVPSTICDAPSVTDEVVAPLGTTSTTADLEFVNSCLNLDSSESHRKPDAAMTDDGEDQGRDADSPSPLHFDLNIELGEDHGAGSLLAEMATMKDIAPPASEVVGDVPATDLQNLENEAEVI